MHIGSKCRIVQWKGKLKTLCSWLKEDNHLSLLLSMLCPLRFWPMCHPQGTKDWISDVLLFRLPTIKHIFRHSMRRYAYPIFPVVCLCPAGMHAWELGCYSIHKSHKFAFSFTQIAQDFHVIFFLDCFLCINRYNPHALSLQ